MCPNKQRQPNSRTPLFQLFREALPLSNLAPTSQFVLNLTQSSIMTHFARVNVCPLTILTLKVALCENELKIVMWQKKPIISLWQRV